jgi:hypothetical protein
VSLRPLAIGVTAHAALGRAGGAARVLARLSTSTYLTADGEIVWLGGPDAVLHPRSILVAAAPPPVSDDVHVEVAALSPWRPVPLALEGVTMAALVERWRALDAATLGTPGGFGALLAGRPLTFPLDGAREAAVALARACAHHEATSVAEAAFALLGVGGGLTPSGDDYVGGALFVRALLGPVSPGDTTAWQHAVERVLVAASTRTHPISVALLGDLATGLSWAPLHALVAALAAGPTAAAREAAHRLVGLGHTSGWDMLAGVAAGLGVLDG